VRSVSAAAVPSERTARIRLIRYRQQRVWPLIAAMATLPLACGEVDTPATPAPSTVEPGPAAASGGGGSGTPPGSVGIAALGGRSGAGNAAAESGRDAGVSPATAGTGTGTAGAGAGAMAGSAGLGGTADAGPAGGQPAPAVDASVPAAPCPDSTYVPGDNPGTLSQGDVMRRYNVYVPDTLKPGVRVPLVLDFHGNGSSGAQEQGGSGWQEKADKEGFIAVFPQGVGNGWNVGNCCGQALSENIDDVGFARSMVEAVSQAACIDPKRVYATGISNGAGLSHRLACEAADVFAAIAAASADLVTDPCTPSRPISELSVRGESDTLVAYEGGNTGSTGWYSPGAKGTLELWKNIDGCSGTPTSALEYCETYTECGAGVEVTLCSLPGVGHILYDNALDFDVPEVAWDMFVRQPMP
jgi:polyhydroxybutyrate depolymerase